jgi:hypothetical protein
MQMKALIVGADRVEPIREELQRASHFGITRTEHWSGRKVGDVRRAVSDDTRLIVVICDRINHKLLDHVRKQAARLGVPTLYSRHSLVEIRGKLEALQRLAH